MHHRRHETKDTAQNIGPVRSLVIIYPLPDSLLDDVMACWPEGRLHRTKVLTYIRHRLSTYDEVLVTFARGHYFELRQAADEKAGRALDEWLLAHPEAAETLKT